ncbi:MAG: restriction endonuclease subunit S [Desulfobacteraceae bacterium]|nr:MAG: restriction endonuclease subunit S [Desulfobacteraceae bacterium]
MIADLKPYPAMKDSGVPWLGDVPEHWEIRKLRQMLNQNTRRNRPDLPLLSVVREKGVIKRDITSKEENYNYIPDDLSNYKVVHAGQFAMNKMKAWQGSYGVSRYDGIVSPAYFVFDLRSVGGEFFHIAIRSGMYVPFFTQSSDGVRIGQWDLAQSRMKEIPFFIPSLPEQVAIVRYVDNIDQRIRRYIRAKQKLIKLLEEQKQAIIHRAVTRGLDPNVRLKPSGVEWLGDVPEHWEVLRVKQCAQTISKGTTPSTEGRELLDSGPVRFLKAENVVDGQIIDKPLCFIDEETNKVLRRSQLKEGDVLFVIAGATLGKITVIQQTSLPANTNQAVAFVRPNQRVLPAYLALWLQSPRIKEMVWLNAVQSAQPNLSMADLGAFSFAVPSTAEQEQVLSWLNDKLQKIKKAIEQATHEISLLREYRTRLIADVVTGKLDVREVAARLPDEPGELEPIDEPVELNGVEEDADDNGTDNSVKEIADAE